MKKIALLILVIINIGYTQTIAPKQALHDSLIKGTTFRNKLDFLTFSRIVAFVSLAPDTSDLSIISHFYILLNDTRTDYPYDYYLQFQLPSSKPKKRLNRYINYIGFIWKIDKEWVWVIEVKLQSTDIWRGVYQGKYRRSKFDYFIKNSLTYDKLNGGRIERKK